MKTQISDTLKKYFKFSHPKIWMYFANEITDEEIQALKNLLKDYKPPIPESRLNDFIMIYTILIYYKEPFIQKYFNKSLEETVNDIGKLTKYARDVKAGKIEVNQIILKGQSKGISVNFKSDSNFIIHEIIKFIIEETPDTEPSIINVNSNLKTIKIAFITQSIINYLAGEKLLKTKYEQRDFTAELLKLTGIFKKPIPTERQVRELLKDLT